jgi:hypothetical protein
MTLRHTLLFSGLALFGGLVGGQIGRPTVAQAQIPPPRSENQVLVPVDGLRFVTENQQTIAVLAHQGGNGVFALLDANGRPSVTFSAGPGGTVSIRTQSDGGLFEVATPDGRSRTRLTTSASGTMFEASSGAATLLLANRAGTSQISIPMPNGRPAFEFLTTANGGQFDVKGSSGNSAFTAAAAPGGGLVTVRDGNGTGTATISGTGQFSSVKGGRTVWTAPPAAPGG